MNESELFITLFQAGMKGLDIFTTTAVMRLRLNLHTAALVLLLGLWVQVRAPV